MTHRAARTTRARLVRSSARGFALTACLALSQAAGHAQGAREAAAASPLESAFAAAQRDPAAIVPLIEAGSRELLRRDAAGVHELAEQLEPWCRRAFFGGEELPGMERLGLTTHTVASGENPTTIARRYRIDHGLLRYLNEGFDPRKLQVGQELKVLDLSDESLQLVVDSERFRLAAWRRAPVGVETSGWLLVAYVPIGVGAEETPTPVGSTRITDRVRNPSWRDPETGVNYAPDDPGNLLGGYWVRLADEGLGGRSGIGLHGYTGSQPERWIGQRASNGCVRLLQRDIDRIFHLALVGTPVELR